MSDLRQPLTLLRGTALMLNIVIGAGLLALPGLAFRDAGAFALVSWLSCALAAAPLLAVFVLLGRSYPNAGGVAHFAQLAFGRQGYAAASLVFLGAVIFGLPSIALTGGHYAALMTGGAPHLIAAGLLLGAMVMHVLSSSLVARANAALAAITVISLVGLILIGLWFLPSAPGAQAIIIPSSLSEWRDTMAPFMMIFFAFTGWEVAAGLSEEFKRPERDFPRAMVASFLLTVLIYLSIAYLVLRLSPTRNYETAVAQIAEAFLGPLGRQATALLASLIIFANLSGAIWAVSRMVFSLSRERFLPSGLQMTHRGTPWMAVAVTTLALLAALSLDAAGLLKLDGMLALAGQNFFVLYGLAAFALLLRARTRTQRLLSSFVVVLVVGLVVLQGQIAFYPAWLLALGVLLGGMKGWQKAASPTGSVQSDPPSHITSKLLIGLVIILVTAAVTNLATNYCAWLEPSA
jgi:amino acid efflux transporter